MKGFVAAVFVALSSMVCAQEIRGTLYASEVWGFVLIACYYGIDLQDCDEDRSAVQAVAQTGASADYAFDGLSSGYYLVIAWRDADGDGELDLDGEDEVAFHADLDGDPALVALPARGVDVVTGSWTMRTAALGATTLVGTLHADDVFGFSVIACAIDAFTQECDPNRVVSQEVTQAGSSAVFRLELPDSSQYLLIAWKDVNANGTLEENGPDLLGYWRDGAGELAYVAPPADDLVLRVGALAPPVPMDPGAIVGTWSSAHGSAVAYFDSATGSYMPASGSGVEFRFRADGSYERFGMISNSFYSTNTTIFVHETGSYSFDGRTLRLRGTSDTAFRRNGELYREENGVAVAWSYAFELIDADTARFDELGTLSRLR